MNESARARNWWKEALEPIEVVLEQTLAEVEQVMPDEVPSAAENEDLSPTEAKLRDIQQRESELQQRLRLAEVRVEEVDQQLTEAMELFAQWQGALSSFHKNQQEKSESRG